MSDWVAEPQRPIRWAARAVMVNCALAAISVGLCATGATRQAVFKSQVDVVRVDVLVLRHGVPVGGLRPADFELRDNGVRQEIVSASLEEVPIEALLVLNASRSITPDKARALREASSAFLDGLTARDRAGLLVFGGRPILVQAPTSDGGRLGRLLQAVEGRGSTALNDAVFAALRLRQPGDARGAVLVFTDGVDNVSWLSPSEVFEAGRRSDAIVHAVVVGRAGIDNALLHELTRGSGGSVWPAAWGPKLADAFRAVLDDLRSRYVLAYYPKDVATDGWHALDVKVRLRSVSITHRSGYYRREGPAPNP